jgi:pterin-4a-carbinolamine dehydratase
MPRLSGWKLAQNKLSRTFEFQDLVQSLSFVNSLVAYFGPWNIIPTYASHMAR